LVALLRAAAAATVFNLVFRVAEHNDSVLIGAVTASAVVVDNVLVAALVVFEEVNVDSVFGVGSLVCGSEVLVLARHSTFLQFFL
jgi:uncharacterized membrane-anchored protein